jgi:hypothetical protein
LTISGETKATPIKDRRRSLAASGGDAGDPFWPSLAANAFSRDAIIGQASKYSSSRAAQCFFIAFAAVKRRPTLLPYRAIIAWLDASNFDQRKTRTDILHVVTR